MYIRTLFIILGCSLVCISHCFDGIVSTVISFISAIISTIGLILVIKEFVKIKKSNKPN